MSTHVKASPARAVWRFVRAGGSALRRRPVRGVSAVVIGLVLLVGARVVLRPSVDTTLTVVVRRDTLTARLTEPGTLRPAQSLVYRSPLNGREAEITFLVPEGTLVGEGDLLVRLETSELEDDLARAVKARRRADVELQVAELERLDAAAAVDSSEGGAGALSVEETRTNRQLAERNVARLRSEYASLVPLLEEGFITREELERSRFELETAEAELELVRRRADVFVEQTHPLNQRRSELQLAQREAQLENAKHVVAEAGRRVQQLAQAIEDCNVYARRPGLAVYEDHMASSPRRRIRVGDRVTPTQGLVRIPEVSRMQVDSSVREADIHRVRPGQPVQVSLEAFPDLRLTGRVVSVGTLARATGARASESKRFDLVVDLDPTTADLRPDMTARLDILVGQRDDVLVLPINAVFDLDGMPVAHVVEGFGIDTRRVELGESTERFVEVLSGVEEGERVALTSHDGVPSTTASTGANGPRPLAFVGSEQPGLGPR